MSNTRPWRNQIYPYIWSVTLFKTVLLWVEESEIGEISVLVQEIIPIIRTLEEVNPNQKPIPIQGNNDSFV